MTVSQRAFLARTIRLGLGAAALGTGTGLVTREEPQSARAATDVRTIHIETRETNWSWRRAEPSAR